MSADDVVAGGWRIVESRDGELHKATPVAPGGACGESFTSADPGEAGKLAEEWARSYPIERSSDDGLLKLAGDDESWGYMRPDDDAPAGVRDDVDPALAPPAPPPPAFELPDPRDPVLAHIHPKLRGLAVPIDSVKLDAANVRRHSKRNLNVIAASMRDHGQRQLLVIREATGCLEAGEGRLLAGKQLGWKWIAVLPCDDDALKAAKYALADNRSSDLSENDDDALAAMLRVMKGEGVDLEELGWDGKEAAKILKDATETGPPPEPEYTNQIAVLITCTDENHQAALLEEFEARGLKVKALLV